MLIPHVLPVLVPTLSTVFGGYVGDNAVDLGLVKDAILTSNYTLINKYQPTALNAAGAYVRLTVIGPLTAGQTCTLSNTYIGKPATSGDAYDFLAGTATRITWDGNNSVTLAAGEVRSSDVVSYTLDDVPTLICFDAASGSYVRYRSGLNTSKNTVYFRSSTTEAGTDNKTSGYSPLGGFSYAINVLEAGN